MQDIFDSCFEVGEMQEGSDERILRQERKGQVISTLMKVRESVWVFFGNALESLGELGCILGCFGWVCVCLGVFWVFVFGIFFMTIFIIYLLCCV